ncbi:TSC22 domain family protein 2-like [Pristis pectinata]|uniref:TSC22 domain family protein 2-like n=1 Tax=Pristis pectinata TaxID=685728 RepID=UPI00223DEC81|nr:TSC22 domain family protein 2-like [Pristis pectinata]
MIGKKRSGFQITSVTLDYDGGGGEGLKEAPNGELEMGGSPAAVPLANGVPGHVGSGHAPAPGAAEPAASTGKNSQGAVLPADRTPPLSATEPPGADGSPRGLETTRDAQTGAPDSPRLPAAAAPQETPRVEGTGNADAVTPRAVPSARSPLRTGCSPGSLQQPGASCSSRFRVVKLDHGLGEPYRRGRWTCTDLYDKDLDGHLLAKVLDGARNVNSLDSHLEITGFAHKAVSQLRHKPHVPKSHGSPPAPCQGDVPRGRFGPAAPGNTLNVLLQAAKTLNLSEPVPVDNQPGRASPPRLPVHTLTGAAASAPGSIVAPKGDGGVLTVMSKDQQKPSTVHLQGARSSPAEQSASNQISPNVSQPSSGEHGAIRKFSEPRSTPTSPVPLTQDASPSRKTRISEVNGASTLRFISPMQTLTTSMLSVGSHQEGDDDSGSSSSMVAIDNKIEQAMDLVKSHLMYAVREEVEVLKEQIKELIDRNTLLERENALLKSLANPEQLSQLQAQMRTAGSSGGSSGSSPASTSTA